MSRLSLDLPQQIALTPGDTAGGSFCILEQESRLAQVHHLAEHRREFITDGVRSELRATWHNDAGYIVISLWRGDTCVATSHLTPKEAGRLATFITGGLADLAHTGMFSQLAAAPISPRRGRRDRFSKAFKTWRVNVGWTLEQIARKLRSVN